MPSTNGPRRAGRLAVDGRAAAGAGAWKGRSRQPTLGLPGCLGICKTRGEAASQGPTKPWTTCPDCEVDILSGRSHSWKLQNSTGKSESLNFPSSCHFEQVWRCVFAISLRKKKPGCTDDKPACPRVSRGTAGQSTPCTPTGNLNIPGCGYRCHAMHTVCQFFFTIKTWHRTRGRGEVGRSLTTVDGSGRCGTSAG